MALCAVLQRVTLVARRLCGAARFQSAFAPSSFDFPPRSMGLSADTTQNWCPNFSDFSVTLMEQRTEELPYKGSSTYTNMHWLIVANGW